MRFADKVVWVTGASSGVGAALAPAFHAEGAHVVLSARRADALAEVGGRCGGPGETMVLPLDLAEADSLGAKADAVLDRFGRVDILVNNAGMTQRALFAGTDMAVYRTLFEVNFFGALALTKAVLPGMIDRGAGHLVAVSSIQAEFSTPLRSGYNASKRALDGFFEALRAELWPHGIAVTILHLGAVRTDISFNALRGDGSRYEKVNRIQAEGMSPERCAARILDAVARRKDEATIAAWRHRLMVYRRRFFPALAARAVRLRPRGGR